MGHDNIHFCCVSDIFFEFKSGRNWDWLHCFNVHTDHSFCSPSNPSFEEHQLVPHQIRLQTPSKLGLDEFPCNCFYHCDNCIVSSRTYSKDWFRLVPIVLFDCKYRSNRGKHLTSLDALGIGHSRPSKATYHSRNYFNLRRRRWTCVITTQATEHRLSRWSTWSQWLKMFWSWQFRHVNLLLVHQKRS